MTVVRRLGPTDWSTLRDVRRASLRDAPDAFRATVAEVDALDEAAWRARTIDHACFVGLEGAAAVGVALGGQLRDPDPDVRTLRSMWVAPELRGSGLAARLVDEVVAWARQDGARRLVLWSLLPAHRAHAFYARYGFTGALAQPPDDDHPAMLRYELAL